MMTVQNHWDVVGRLREVRRAVVASEQEGRVVEVQVEEGDPIVANQTVLARIDDVWAKLDLQRSQADLATAQANVAEAQANVDQASRDFERLESLLIAQSARPKEVDDARTKVQAETARLQSAQAAVLSAQSAVDRTREQVQRLTILAPFDGTVVRKMTEVGQWVTPGDGVAEVISRGKIDAMIDVSENLINQVTLGMELDVQVDALRKNFTGHVDAINPYGTNAARTFPVRVQLDDHDGTLKPGMSVTARVPTTQQMQAMTIPRDALTRTAMGNMVWINANGVAMQTPVQVLFSVADRYVVQPVPGPGAGLLVDNASVVIEGAERIYFPGQPLAVVPPFEASTQQTQQVQQP